GERFLEDAGGSLQLAQLRVRAPERICDRERSLRMCLGGFLEQRHRPARVADRVGDLAEAGEGSRPQRPILRIERRREESLGLPPIRHGQTSGGALFHYRYLAVRALTVP